MNEEWKKISGFEGIYLVSNLGRIKSLERTVITKKGKKLLLKEKIVANHNTKKYLIATLCKDGQKKQFYVHRLVAAAFIENPFRYPFINHIDGTKTNNNIANLEWCTNQQNMKKAYESGQVIVQKNRKTFSKITKKDVLEIRKMRENGEKLKSIAQKYHVDQSNVSCICLRKTWSNI